jgi:hypothetical protein
MTIGRSPQWRERDHLTAMTTVQTPTVAVDPWGNSHGSERPTTTGPMTFAAVTIKNKGIIDGL